MADKNLYVKLGVDNKDFKKGFEESKKIAQAGGKELEKEAARMALAVSKKIGGLSLKSQARQLENLTAKMAEAGMSGTKAFTMTAQAAGRLKAEIDDTKGIVDAFRPDAPFRALSTTLGAAAQGFAGVQGAMALFGNESEDLQKTLLKVQAAMAFAEGFKAIDGLSDGFQQLNLVIKANPLIAGVTAVAAVAAAFWAFNEATAETSHTLEALNEIQDRANEATLKEKVELDNLLRVYNDKNTTDEERLDIQRQLVDQYPEYLGQISTEKVEMDKVNQGVISYIKLLDLKAKAQAAQELYVEALKEQIKAEAEVRKSLDQNENYWLSMFKAQLGMGENAHTLDNINGKVTALKSVYEQLAAAATKAGTAQTSAFGVSPSAGGGGKKEKPYVSPFPMLADTSGLASKGLEDIATKAGKAVTSIDAVKYSILETSEAAREFKNTSEQMSKAFEQMIEGAIADFGTAIGDLLSGSDTAFQDFGAKIMAAIAGFMDTLGKAMISTALAADAFQKFLLTNPIAALAAGVALTAGAAIVRNMMSKGISQGEGFAEGGVIGGNSFTGDRLLAPVNSGEVVLNTGQQNNLMKLANGGVGGGRLEARFSRTEMIVWLEKGNKDLGRG